MAVGRPVAPGQRERLAQLGQVAGAFVPQRQRDREGVGDPRPVRVVGRHRRQRPAGRVDGLVEIGGIGSRREPEGVGSGAAGPLVANRQRGGEKTEVTRLLDAGAPEQRGCRRERRRVP
jgi:hypothetical protein